MKRLFEKFSLMAVAVMSVFSCEKSIDNISESEKATVLYATTATVPETKVEFTDNDSQGILLQWEREDVFTIYNTESGLRVGNFTCTSVESGQFTAEDGVVLTEDEKYVAIYPASDVEDLADAREVDLISEQNGDEINNLDASCMMEASFTYSKDNEDDVLMTFEHKKSVMTFKFESSILPEKLIFENGDKSYTVTYSELEPVGTVYTSHIMIEPCDDTERALTFSLYAEGESDPYDVRTVTASKAYIAGVRYTSPVSDLDTTIWLGSGTEEDPYQVTTSDQLRLLSTNVSSGISYSGECFAMTQDIDLGGESNEFVAIGNSTNSFQGTFDGCGYEVSGLYINNSSDYQGLFGYTSGAAIKNIGVSGDVISSSYIGGIVGRAYSSTVVNCYYTGSVSSSATYSYVGGVVGFVSSTTFVVNCYNTGSVNGNWYVGGIVGYTNGENAIVTNCYNIGSVSGSSSCGAVVGYQKNGTISNCYWDSSIYTGDGIGSGSSTNIVGMSTSYMQSDYFVSVLNNGSVVYNSTYPAVEACAWEQVSGDYPILDCDNTSEASWLGNGIGTEGDPYQISTSDELRLFSGNVNMGLGYSGEYFAMTQDIDLGGESNEFAAIGNSTNKFQGTFDGCGYEVSGLYINNSSVYQGLFGYTSGATIKNVGVSGDVISSSYIGGIVGRAYSSAVVNCYYTGSVSSSATDSYVGGVVGFVSSTTFVVNCYNTGSVNGNRYVGGIVGYTSGENAVVTNCYNIGSVSSSSSSNSCGAVVGYQSTGTVSNCYWDSSIYTGDGIGSGSGTNIVGMSTSYMQSDYFVSVLNNGSVVYNSTTPAVEACAWEQVSGDYPILDCDNTSEASWLGNGTGTEGDPYQISTSDELRLFSGNVNMGLGYSGEYFAMTQDIDLGGESNEFIAIGNSTNKFQGTFDGCGYEVSGLYINNSDSYQGLFGYISGATIKNVGVSGDVISSSYIGGIAGRAYSSTVVNCYYAGSVSSSDTTNSYIGGIVGYVSSTTFVVNCYNTGNVNGNRYVGGIVGYTSGSYAIVTNCYSVGAVSGSSYTGGVVGYRSSGTISNCYWDSYIYTGNGIGSGSGTNIVGMSTDDMKADAFVITLNDNAVTYNSASPTIAACAWKEVSEDYPTLDFYTVPSSN
ncbi:MAG: hypothetical protein R3Y26_05490 [Rikenellaceae bacterium]